MSTCPMTAFKRYKRAIQQFPCGLWSDEEIEKYDADRKFYKEMYEENRLVTLFRGHLLNYWSHKEIEGYYA